MTALIPVEPRQIGDNCVPAVNGRDLHAFLQVPTKFKDWLPRRIREFRFDEGSDFSSFLSRSASGRRTREYALSLGMAKVLAMLEKSDRGQEARAFFLACERDQQTSPIVHAPTLPPLDPAYVDAIADAVVARLAPRALIHEAPARDIDPILARKAEAFDQLTAERGQASSMTAAAKALGWPPMKFIDRLADLKWIFRGADGWQAFQNRIEAGHLEHRLHVVTHDAGLERAHAQVRVTVRGLAKLAELLQADPGTPLTDIARVRKQRQVPPVAA